MERPDDFNFRMAYTLRPYQELAVKLTIEALRKKKTPVVVIPTGGGKSIVIAELCKYKRLVENKRILVLASRKELVRQNYEKIERLLDGLDERIGIYSAGLSSREIGDITVGNIQSIYRLKNYSHLDKDVVIIDEAHEINHEAEGMYRNLLEKLKRIKPIEVVGLTATPYRLGHGLITTPPALFDEIIRDESMTIKELQRQGYLTELVAKETVESVDVSEVKIRGGEFVEEDLQFAVKKLDLNSVIGEICVRGHFRKKWLVFTVGIEHADKVNDLLVERGINSFVVHSSVGDSERDRIINAFLHDESVRCLVNANILTTGFDHPAIDLIAIIRPTMSRGLFVQMVGRGFRVADGKKNCLVLDFARNFERHGVDLDSLSPMKKNELNTRFGDGKFQQPATKSCPQCKTIISLGARVCPECGYIFALESGFWELTQDWEIKMKKKYQDRLIVIKRIEFSIEFSQRGNRMLVVRSYYDRAGAERKINDYLMIFTPSLKEVYAKSIEKLKTLIEKSKINQNTKFSSSEEMLQILQQNVKPVALLFEYQDDGFMRVVEYLFKEDVVERLKQIKSA